MSLPECLPQAKTESSWPSSSVIPRDDILLTPTAKLGQKRRASRSPESIVQRRDNKSPLSKAQTLPPTPPPSGSPVREERQLVEEFLPEAQTESTPCPRLIFSARAQTQQIKSIVLFGEHIQEFWQAVKTPTSQYLSET
jgi:hypothetical protein